jgi:GNAT superfamily N-acetyltransferase
MIYRQANESDIPAIAHIRATEPETEAYWNQRISAYWNRTHHPQQALLPRIIYVATDENTIIGFIGGHLTHRFDCDGELQWIDVIPAHRKSGIASELLQQLAKWFVEQKALRICVNCAPDNLIAQNFYKQLGAENLNEHWLFWSNISTIIKVY